MVDDIDIYRTAKLLIDRDSEDAPVHAAMRADELMDQEYVYQGPGIYLPVYSYLPRRPARHFNHRGLGASPPGGPARQRARKRLAL